MPAGRPSKWRADNLDQVYRLALLGLSDEEIASVFGIAVSTLHRWDADHAGFREARARGKEIADSEVAEKLYQRAKGYSHDAVKIFQYEGKPIEVTYVEHYPPDTQAATWWLKNRQGKYWKDKSETQHSGSLTVEQMITEAAAKRRDGGSEQG